MKLPNNERAYIEPSKLLNYLLSETHPVGGPKARFFREVGFDASNADGLEEAILTIARTENVLDMAFSPYGEKYVLDGLIDAPNRGRVNIRTVWIIEMGAEFPRFVTAYPL